MKFGTHEHGYMIDIFFALALFCVFTASALLVVVIGANVYKSTVARMQDNYSARTALSYITEKIRQHDMTDAVDTMNFEDGTQALVLRESYDSGSYNTYIYEDAGELMELYINASDTPEKTAGRKIMEVKDFSVEKINSTLFYVTVKESDGKMDETYVSVHSSSEGTDKE